MQEPQTYISEAQTDAVQICRQNSGEFEDVVSRYLPTFYRRAYRFMRDPHDAEDAVQDALLSAYKHLDQFKGTAKMATWLTSIVTNCALTQLRRRPRKPHVSLDERLDEEQVYYLSDRLADARPNPEDECMWSELHGHFLEFLAELSPTLRETIQLRGLEGRTTSEAASVLGVSQGTVKANVSRARTKLKQLMREV
jgi:RNA polymerase sigma-70 factor (ECF subfamily)